MKNPWEDGKKEVESLFKERMAKIIKSGEGNRYLDPQKKKKKKKKMDSKWLTQSQMLNRGNLWISKNRTTY